MTTIAPNTLAKRKWRSNPNNKLKEKLKRDRSKEWVATNKRRQTPEGWAKFAMPRLRYRAKKQSLEFNLEWTDIIPPSRCPIFNIPLNLVSSGHMALNGASVDRVDNTKGYIKGNVCIISNRANILKKNGTLADFKALLKYMEDWYTK